MKLINAHRRSVEEAILNHSFKGRFRAIAEVYVNLAHTAYERHYANHPAVLVMEKNPSWF